MRRNCNTLAVCPGPLQAALSSWVAYRQGQGHIIDVIDVSKSADELRATIKRCAETGNLHHVVLIGDVRVDRGRLNVSNTTPTDYVASIIIVAVGGSERNCNR